MHTSVLKIRPFALLPTNLWLHRENLPNTAVCATQTVFKKEYTKLLEYYCNSYYSNYSWRKSLSKLCKIHLLEYPCLKWVKQFTYFNYILLLTFNSTVKGSPSSQKTDENWKATSQTLNPHYTTLWRCYIAQENF